MRNKLIKILILIQIVVLSICMAFAFFGCFSQNSDDKSNAFDLEESELFLYDAENIVFDGLEKRVKIDVLDARGSVIATIEKDGNHSDLEVSYQNNVAVGRANVTVTAKAKSKKFKGAKSNWFKINGRTETVSTFEELKNALLDNAKSVTITENIVVAENQSLTILDGTELLLNGKEFTVNGSINNLGKISFSESQGGKFTVNGQLVNDGYVILEENSNFYNYGEVSNSGTISATKTDSGVYSNSDIEGTIYGNYYRRYLIDDFNPSIPYEEIDYNGQKLTPSVSLSMGSTIPKTSDYEITYLNNQNAGTATVTITATENSKTIYGSFVITFTINKSIKTVSTEQDLIDAMGDVNYQKIVYSKVKIESAITIPQGCVVEFNTNVKSVYESLTVNGTLKILADNRIEIKNGISGSGEVVIEQPSSAETSTVAILNNEISVAKITNKGEIYDAGELSVLPTVNIKNDGEIYTNTTLESGIISSEGVGTETVRKQIELTDVVIIEDEFVYDGQKHVLSVEFLKGDAFGDYYNKKIYYKSAPDENVITPKDKGELSVLLSFFETSKTYFGEIVVDYEILAGTTSVEYASQLTSALKNDNFGTVIIESNMDINQTQWIRPNKTLVVDEGVTLFFYKNTYNVGNFKIDGTLINNGTIVNTKTDTEGEFDQIFTGSATFVGKIINNGEIYLNANCKYEVENNGALYVRVDIENSSAVDFVDSYDYGEDVFGKPIPRCPSVNLTIDKGVGGVPNIVNVPTEEYEVSYNYNKYATVEANQAYAYVKAKTLSKYFYGDKKLPFTIKQIDIVVNTGEELLDALDNLNAVDTANVTCNYGVITLGANITLENDNATSKSFIIREGTTVDCNGYILDIQSPTLEKGGYKLFVNGTLIITGADEMINVIIGFKEDRGSGQIIGYASTARELYVLARTCDKVFVQQDILEKANIFPTANNACIIDLQGHSVKELDIDLTYHSVTITSSKNKASIETLKADSLHDREAPAEILTLDNLAIGTATNLIATDVISSNVTITTRK